MNKITQNFLAKSFAFVLLFLSFSIFLLNFVAAIIMYNFNFYTRTYEQTRTEILQDVAYNSMAQAFDWEYDSEDPQSIRYYKNEYYSYDNNTLNMKFILKNSEGEVVFNDYKDEKYILKVSQEVSHDIWNYDHEAQQEILLEGKPYYIEGFVLEEMIAQDRLYYANLFVETAYSLRYLVIGIAAGTLALSIMLFVFLMISAGRQKDSTEIHERFFDKIPLEILTSLYAIMFVLQALIVFDFIYHEITSLVVAGIFIVLDVLLIIPFAMSISVRLKKHKLLKNTITYKVLRFFVRKIRKIITYTKYTIAKLPLVWKVVLFLLGWCFLEFIGIVATIYGVSSVYFFWFISRVFIAVFIVVIAINLRRLQEAGQKIATGNLEFKVDSEYMFGDFKRHAQDLNNISMGMAGAVEDRLKSERFKTELITNVSHDIKTPLTSIINYTDLLKKEKTDNKNIKDYIEIIDKHSHRLKKLTEDLVEASKASTGNIQINPEPCELKVLINQTIGEYEEKLKENNLNLVTNFPEYPVSIMADGRLLWRVLDNIMNNVIKYAQPETRVYFDLTIRTDYINNIYQSRAVIMIRNISKYELNISSEELMERFVRGDSARNTEGNGLGLSIARSLTELQNGSFAIEIDGDLFKTIVTFPIPVETNTAQEN